jgi:PAS domain S-box-containing protein
MKTLVPNNDEVKRLEALHQYQILDTLPEQAFDDLVYLAAQICRIPIALISLIDADRQWFKAKLGIDVQEMPIDIGFAPICMNTGDVLVIPDTLADERFANNSVVTSYPYVRFYAGIPLFAPEGVAVGALCIADRVPREITPEQIEALQAISRLVVRQLELRRSLTELASIKTEYKQSQTALYQSESTLRSFFESTPMMMGVVKLVNDDILHISDNATTAKFFGLTPQAMQNRLASELGIPQEYVHQLINHYREAERTKLPVTFEYIHETPQGKKYLRGTVSSIAATCCDRAPQFAYAVEDITESKRIEEERQQLLSREQAARNRITNIFESITDGFLALDGEWRFTYINKQAELFLQRKREELLGKNVWEEFPEAVVSKFYREYHKAVSEQISVEFEEFYPPLNAWFEAHAYPSKEGLSVYFQDITERRQAEDRLRWKEALLRSMTKVSPLAFYVVDNQTQEILYFNDIFCEICSIQHLKERMERGELKHQDVMRECSKFVDISLFASCHPGTDRQCSCEDEVFLENGRVIRRFSQQIYNDDNQHFGQLYIFEDITSRKKAEQQIREQAALLDIASDAIIVKDLSNKILLWNKSAEKLYGWRSEEAIGSYANELLHNEPLSTLREIHNTVLECGSWQGELQKNSKSGNKIIVESRWTLVRDEYGQPKSILVVDTDITQKKQLEKQFLRAQRMESIGTLASGIAHDLNNVLSPILMSVQLLKFKCQDQRDRQILTIVENNAKRGANLVKQVLAFARGIEGDRTVLQVKHLISEMKQIVEQTFPKSIKINTEIQSDLWQVRGDSTQLHQVLMNLCLNARDAMPGGGNLSIAAKNIFIDENYARMHLDAKVGSYIVLSVADTGFGIPNELLDRIFEPFFTTKEFGQGTGLGLSTVMGIIKGHNGFITVSSNLGRGTKFKVYLPAIQTHITQPPEDLEMPRGQGQWILIVDDEAAIREITTTSLENHNYKVLTASDGIEAVALYAQHKDKISAAIIDIMMPNMDGKTTINTLQKMNPLLHIIAVSGLTTSEQILLNNNNKYIAFLPKPYTAQELLKTLHVVISH